MNNPAPCCGKEPTLRLRTKFVKDENIPYVEFVCRICNRKGGMAITENGALKNWNEEL